jgi:EthD domain
MIKLTAAISKRDDWTVAEWLSHYKERHASLSASVRNFTRHGIRYLQNYAIHAPEIPEFAEANTPHVAMTELWFPSVEALRTAYEEPDYMKYLRTDELRFCTFENLIAGVGREVALLEPEADLGDKRYAYQERAKIFVFRTGAAGDSAQFQHDWHGQRAPEMMRTAHFRRFVRRYVQTQMLDVDVGIPGGVRHHVQDEFWFATVDDAVAFWSAYRCHPDDVQADARYVHPDSTWVIFAREHEVFGPLPD